MTVNAGDTFMREGETDECLFIIASGSVNIHGRYVYYIFQSILSVGSYVQCKRIALTLTFYYWFLVP